MKIKNQLSTFYFSSLNLKKNEIGHGFSLFIFQLAEKMNDPKIHALFYRLINLLFALARMLVISIKQIDAILFLNQF